MNPAKSWAAAALLATLIAPIGAFAADAGTPIELVPRYTLPAEPDPVDLRTQFPECKPTEDSIAQLKKCQADLETYREGVLEEYNRKIKRYIGELKRLDDRARQDANRGRITQEQYEQLVRTPIAAQLEKTAADGELFDHYRTSVIKYRNQVKWAGDTLNIAYKKAVRPA